MKTTKHLILISAIVATVLNCSQKENSSDLNSNAVSDTSKITAADLALLPAKGPYFPCDERIIEDRWMVKRFVEPFEKHPENPVLVKDFPWEGTGPNNNSAILFDPQDGKFKMWYSVWDSYAYYNKLAFSYHICYAESKDGVNWTKPIIGLFDRRGTMDKNNNCIILGRQKTQGIDVELNPAPKSPEEKFIAIHNDSGGVFVSYSSDGKKFNCSFKPSAVWYHSDTHNNFVYDEIRERWLMYVRPRAYAGEGIERVNRRRVAVKESDDLVAWSHERTVLVPEENDVTDFYGLHVFRRGDLFFGHLPHYDAGQSDKVWSELVWSPDGYKWNRLPQGTQKSQISLGRVGDWDAGQVYVIDKPVIVDDEMLFYYGGNKTTHNEPGSPAIGMAKTKLDRLIGVVSIPDTLGRILTRPFKVGGNLFVNAKAKGQIRIEVRSAIRDEPLEGWTFDDCSPFTGDDLSAPVQWRTKHLNDLKGKVVRLRFQLEDATLYSFDMR